MSWLTVMVQFRSTTGAAAVAGAAGASSTPVARVSSARYRAGRRGRRIMFPPAGWGRSALAIAVGLGADVGVDLGGDAGQWGGDAVTFKHGDDVGGAGEVADDDSAGAAATGVERAGHRGGTAGGWDAQDELARSGQLGAVGGLLGGDGEVAGAGAGVAVDGAGEGGD